MLVQAHALKPTHDPLPVGLIYFAISVAALKHACVGETAARTPEEMMARRRRAVGRRIFVGRFCSVLLRR